MPQRPRQRQRAPVARAGPDTLLAGTLAEGGWAFASAVSPMDEGEGEGEGGVAVPVTGTDGLAARAAALPPAPERSAVPVPVPVPAVSPLPVYFSAAHLARLLSELNPRLCALAVAAAPAVAGAAGAAARRAELVRLAAQLLQQLARDAVVFVAPFHAARGPGHFGLLSLQRTVVPAVRAALRGAVLHWRRAHAEFRERSEAAAYAYSGEGEGEGEGEGAGAGANAEEAPPPEELIVTLDALLESARAAQPALRNLSRRFLAQGAEQLEAAGALVRLRGEAYLVLACPEEEAPEEGGEGAGDAEGVVEEEEVDFEVADVAAV
jgi:hypothetical protein